MLVAMWVGGVISAWINRTLAGGHGTAGLHRGDARGSRDPQRGRRHEAGRNSQQVVDDLGNVALSLFLVLALMTLRLYEIVHVALPLIIIVAVQVGCVGLSVWAASARWGATTKAR